MYLLRVTNSRDYRSVFRERAGEGGRVGEGPGRGCAWRVIPPTRQAGARRAAGRSLGSS